MKEAKNLYRYLISLLSLAGLGIMGYLAYIKFSNVQSFCDISAEVSCDLVNASLYSEILGIPVSILGMIFFAGLLLFTLLKKTQKDYRTFFLVVLFLFIPALYLTAMELFFINSICILCEASKILILGIVISSYFASDIKKPELGKLIAPVIIAGIVFSGIGYFVQTSGAEKRDFTVFVEYLNDEGWTYYKSYTCANCKRQEREIGPAYIKLDSVECHPDGPGGQPKLCLEKDIDKTPTWIREINGREVERLEGFYPLLKLIELTGYEGEVPQR